MRHPQIVALSALSVVAVSLAAPGVAHADLVNTIPYPLQIPANSVVDNMQAQPLPAGMAHMVSLGDSFAANGPALGNTVEPCFRNRLAYPAVIARDHDVPLKYTACAGAVTDHYWAQYESDMPMTKKGEYYHQAFYSPFKKSPQKDSITKDSMVVTIQFGGNDMYSLSMLDKAVDCGVSWLTNKPCVNQLLPPDSNRFTTVYQRLTAIYKDAKKRANPGAKIVAIGYYNLGVNPAFGNKCMLNVNGMGLSEDLGNLFRAMQHLNTLIKKAAKEAGILFVDPNVGMNLERSICGRPLVRWVSLTGVPDLNIPIHPTIAGHRHIADMVEHAIAASPKK